jgi:hypothetical protein
VVETLNNSHLVSVLVRKSVRKSIKGELKTVEFKRRLIGWRRGKARVEDWFI